MGIDNLRSLLGIALIVGIAWAFSEDRKAVRWRVVLSGVALQLAFGIVVLKTGPGIRFFEGVSYGVNRLIDFTNEGSGFVFGSLVRPDAPAGFVFAMKVLPSVIFVGALMSVLYHVGLMQRVVQGMSWVMAKAMGVSGAESLASAVNVFVGQTEAPLVIRPYLAGMTRSELMAVMVGGFASIAGGVLVAYVSMGIDAAHLLTASVLSAPATLVIAKVLVPEREDPSTMGHGYVPLEKVSVNVVDAAASGASDGVKLAINVGGMLIAFIALVALVNALLGGLGALAAGAVGVEKIPLMPDGRLSLEGILGLVFWPLAFVIGCPLEDCTRLGLLTGTQVTLNEFVAYVKLAEMLPESLETAKMSPRAFMLATYSLCGFANVSSIGIQLGGIGALVESRRPDLAKLGVKAMLAGILSLHLAACVAGALVTDAEADYRLALTVAERRVADGDLEKADALLLEAARRRPGTGWADLALEKARRVKDLREAVATGKRALADVRREKL